jgi:hypothetical protein
MRREQSEEFIRKSAEVTDSMVVDAKTFFLRKAQGTSTMAAKLDTKELINEFLVEIGVQLPKTLHVGLQDEAQESDLKKIADSLAWDQAASEAIWRLVNISLFIPCQEPIQRRVSVTRESDHGSDGMSFDDLMMPIPGKVMVAPTHRWGAKGILMDGDLYLRELNISNLHPDVELALRESVACFRAEFFTAALAMLGKASEGGWLELGASIVAAAPSDQRGKISNHIKRLEDPSLGIAKKILDVVEIFRSSPALNALSEKIGLGWKHLQQVAVWSDVVRDSRNTIHFGVAPALANTYEKVGVLLIAAVPHLRVLYKLKEKADEIALHGK